VRKGRLMGIGACGSCKRRARKVALALHMRGLSGCSVAVGRSVKSPTDQRPIPRGIKTGQAWARTPRRDSGDVGDYSTKCVGARDGATFTRIRGHRSQDNCGPRAGRGATQINVGERTYPCASLETLGRFYKNTVAGIAIRCRPSLEHSFAPRGRDLRTVVLSQQRREPG
jgi:hypothetical protein